MILHSYTRVRLVPILKTIIPPSDDYQDAWVFSTTINPDEGGVKVQGEVRKCISDESYRRES